MAGGAAEEFSAREGQPDRQAEIESSMRRILQAITGLEIGGGIASVARCVARSLEELARAGGIERADRVLLQDDPRHPPQPPRFGEQHLSGDGRIRFVAQLWRCLRAHRHDFVLFDQLGLARSFQLPIPIFFRTPYAIFCHGIEIDRATGGERKRALERAWRLVCNSERTAQRVRQYAPRASERVRVAPLCIDPELVRGWERSAGGRPAPPREPAALIVGRMWSEEPGKGHDALLEAWPEVRRRQPAAQLWVVGDGDDRPRLERKAATLAGGAGIRFLGRIDDAALADLYRRASLFAMPSRQEGFGLVYAEAMWHGLPCIGSTSDSAGEVIRAGESGVLVPYGDAPAIAAAVAELLGNPERARRVGEEGARQARAHFAYPRFRRDLLRALDLPELEDA